MIELSWYEFAISIALAFMAGAITAPLAFLALLRHYDKKGEESK